MLPGPGVNECCHLAVVINEVPLSCCSVPFLPSWGERSTLVHSTLSRILPLCCVVFVVHKIYTVGLGIKATLYNKKYK